MRCLFAVSSWFVQCASRPQWRHQQILYCTVLSLNMRKIINEALPVPLFPWNKLACYPVPQKSKICFLMFPVPQYCLCSPQNLTFVPLFPWNKYPFSPVPQNHWEGLINHWCSVVPEKSQPSGPTFNGKLGKPRFPLERWALGLGFVCPNRTPMMDFIYLTFPYQPQGKIENLTDTRGRHAGCTSIRDVIVMLKWPHHVAS